MKCVKGKGVSASETEVEAFDDYLEMTIRNRNSPTAKTWEEAIMNEARSRLLLVDNGVRHRSSGYNGKIPF